MRISFCIIGKVQKGLCQFRIGWQQLFEFEPSGCCSMSESFAMFKSNCINVSKIFNLPDYPIQCAFHLSITKVIATEFEVINSFSVEMA